MSLFFVPLGHPGEKLGDRYELVEELGHGSFGIVWKVKRLTDGEIIALKIPRDQELGEKVLRQEPDLVRAFNHPNIVRIFGGYTISGLFVIEMELVEGYSLAQILDGVSPQHPLSYVQILRWAAQILAGLATLHGESVVHGDIKPQNILVNQRGQAKLVDFGTSYRLDDVWVWTKRAGTEPYWAPEVAFDERRSLVSDIYSLGVVLYEMATGQLPYHSPFALLADQQMPRPRELNPDIPSQLESIILRAMARLPEERYANCRAMLADVTRALAEMEDSARSQRGQRTEPSRIGLRLDSSSPLYYLEQAKHHIAAGDLENALVAAQVAVDRSGEHPNYLRLLAGVCLRLNYQQRAIETYETLLSVYQKFYPERDDQIQDVLERLGKLYIANKLYHKAVVVYERLVASTDQSAYALFKLAVVYGLEGYYRKAIERLEQVRRHHPDAVIVHNKLGWAHMAEGNIRQALSYYNQALILDPADPFSLYELARYHHIIGDRQTARRYLARLQVADKFGEYLERGRELSEYNELA